MPLRPALPPQVPHDEQERLRWDIFCRVIDNHGDLGVCWRLSADLADRGHQVRLWVDDASALAWMAPQGHPRVQVLPWSDTPLTGVEQPGDVAIEAFGCELPPRYQAALLDATQTRPERAPVWINLEYLSAEPYVERSHGLPSPVMSGPAKGLTKWFFYPGFTLKTGGLIREPWVTSPLHAPALPHLHGDTKPTAAFQRALRISLFCYEPPCLASWLHDLSQSPHPVHLWVAAGRSQTAVQHDLPPGHRHGSALNLRYLPYLTQLGFDRLLRHADLNIVRGEDSLVRALWAGRPLIWHIYPQTDGAHLAKLEAFLAMSQAPKRLADFHRRWNAPQASPLPRLNRADLQTWSDWAESLRQSLLGQPDLTTQLIDFVASKR
jgi:uncharacterized repeat protein (TIGR03837 family)